MPTFFFKEQWVKQTLVFKNWSQDKVRGDDGLKEEGLRGCILLLWRAKLCGDYCSKCFCISPNKQQQQSTSAKQKMFIIPIVQRRKLIREKKKAAGRSISGTMGFVARIWILNIWRFFCFFVFFSRDHVSLVLTLWSFVGFAFCCEMNKLALYFRVFNSTIIKYPWLGKVVARSPVNCFSSLCFCLFVLNLKTIMMYN